MTGQRFGRWIVVSQANDYIEPKTGQHRSRWNCKCDCENVRDVLANDLIRGKSKSCGCYKRQISRECHTKHGLCRERVYKVYSGMITRCYNQNEKSYKYYGGRGITVCDEWKNDFKKFHDWAMANGYQDDLTIERIDVNGDYCPENCTWIPFSEQNRNKNDKTNGKVGFRGITITENKKYLVRINQIKIGRFDDLEKAIIARKQAEIKYWG